MRDLSTITTAPTKRLPVHTIVAQYDPSLVGAAISRELVRGGQIFYLHNRVKTIDAAAEKVRKLAPDAKVAVAHGQMTASQLEDIMSDFVNGKIDILVSTTVVEVGVDVPNATVIVIENAERFGLSQLHQLRGRVGRSDLQSYCVLSSNTKSQETRARLDIMTQTNDGFVIAEKDLQIRGPGEFLGTRQSGLPDMIIADIVADSKILELARSEAVNFAKTYDIKDFPLLENSKGLNFDGDIFNS